MAIISSEAIFFLIESIWKQAIYALADATCCGAGGKRGRPLLDQAPRMIGVSRNWQSDPDLSSPTGMLDGWLMVGYCLVIMVSYFRPRERERERLKPS